jgi:hypothetical protein
MIALLMMAEVASLQTGNGLLEACTSIPEMQIACIEYVSGVADGASAVQREARSRSVCIPRDAQLGQMKDVVVNYLQAHPEIRQNHSGELVLDALQRAFPCSR